MRAMISLQQISLHRGVKPLLENANMILHAGERAAVVGVNGCGKSTLFQLLLGTIQSDAGEVFIPPDLRIAHMQQEVAHSTCPARDYILDGHTELRALEKAIDKAQEDEDYTLLANLHGKMDAIDGYNQGHVAETIMLGLGFKVGDYERPVDSFSGGWRIRLNLARTLLRPSDALLLDEPTNHLDLEAIHWLEEWIQRYPGNVLLISHDRDFIDACVQRIFHIHDLQIDTYTGSYSDFERQRAEKLILQQSIHQKQQQRKAELQGFIDRFRAKASKAKQAQSRIKALERMQFVGAVREASEYRFSIPHADKTASPLINWFEVDLGYPGKTIINKANLAVNPGLRLALLGVNGAGKSTVIKTLAGELAALAGEVTVSEHLRLGYFAQHQLEALDNNASPILHLQRLSPNAREQEIRNFLGGFRIQGDMATSTIAHFSGGEKARLALAIVAWQKPNLLLLDEPTNHLDLEMREALAEALQSYQGAVILVSHDRYLIRHCVDDFMLVADGKLQEFNGDLDDYYRLTQKGSNTTDNGNAPVKQENRKLQRQQAAQQREKLASVRKEVKKLEKQIEKLEEQREKIELELSDSSIYDAENKDRLSKLLKEQAQIASGLAKAEEQWLEQQSLLDTE